MDSIIGGKKLEQLLKEIKEKAANTELKIGILEGATNSKGDSIAGYAADNEFGGSGPPRPFMRMTAKKHGKEWSDKVAHLIQGMKRFVIIAPSIEGNEAYLDAFLESLKRSLDANHSHEYQVIVPMNYVRLAYQQHPAPSTLLTPSRP